MRPHLLHALKTYRLCYLNPSAIEFSMKGHVWAVEELIKDWMLLDAYILLRSLGYDKEKIVVIGVPGRFTIRELATAHQYGTKLISDPNFRVYFKGGPGTELKHFVTVMRCYVADRVLKAILTQGHKKVAKIIDEVARDQEMLVT